MEHASYTGQTRNAYILAGKVKERDHLGDLAVDGITILRWK
jgi:hypothetical protein